MQLGRHCPKMFVTENQACRFAWRGDSAKGGVAGSALIEQRLQRMHHHASTAGMRTLQSSRPKSKTFEFLCYLLARWYRIIYITVFQFRFTTLGLLENLQSKGMQHRASRSSCYCVAVRDIMNGSRQRHQDHHPQICIVFALFCSEL